jgi:xylulokinase
MVTILPLVTLLLGIDLGVGSLKASLIRPDGSVAGEASAPVRTSMPHPGWSEQDPGEWWQALCQGVSKALAASGSDAGMVAGVAVSAGAHIGVLTDAADRVLRPAILWSDTRSAPEAAELHDRAGDRIIASSLNRANPTWLLPQLLWLRRHQAELVGPTHRIYLAKDWLRTRLTGSWETDWSDVVGALMGDVATRGWSAELAALAGWDTATLPPVTEPTSVVGSVGREAAAATGLRVGTPVVCGSNDTTIELFGCGAINPGDGAVKLATAGVTYQVTEGPLVRPPISCYPHIVHGLYYTATGTNSCASAHRWIRDQFFPAVSFDEMDLLASSAPPGSEGLLFHPYLQGERAPHWDPKLRADMLGLTIRHTRAHVARATYEGIAYSIRDALVAAEGLGMRYDSIRLIGGGARSGTWRQIMADVLGKEILVPRNGDASFGDALVAGIGVGIFQGPEDAVKETTDLVAHHQPDPERGRLYTELFEIYQEAQRRLAELDHRLHDLLAAT